jgi:hypothetical protein
MALIQTGSFSDLSVVVRPEAAEALEGANEVDSFGVLAETSSAMPADSFDFAISHERRGLALQSLRLEKGFQSLIRRLFDATSDVYFLAWAWDFSGQQAVVYPGAATDTGAALIPMKGGELREFLGAGVALFPERLVTAGIALRIQVWQSKQDVREFGKTMTTVAEAIQQSQLNSLLTVLAVATGATTATISLVANASLELADVVGKILQASSDDYVDFYEGYFPASAPWTPETQSWQGHASEVSLRRLA